jgi:flagella basal body P-ring formation protein FlgA
VAKIDHSGSASNNLKIVSVEFSYNDRLLKRIKTPVRLVKFLDAPVANRDIRPGEKIARSDIEYRRIESNAASASVPAADDIAGRKAARWIREGEAFNISKLEKEILIKHGENVTINVIAGAVRVRTLGQALTDAAAGGIIRVKRSGDRTVLQGKVAPDGSVIISNNKYLSTSQ